MRDQFCGKFEADGLFRGGDLTFDLIEEQKKLLREQFGGEFDEDGFFSRGEALKFDLVEEQNARGTTRCNFFDLDRIAFVAGVSNARSSSRIWDSWLIRRGLKLRGHAVGCERTVRVQAEDARSD